MQGPLRRRRPDFMPPASASAWFTGGVATPRPSDRRRCRNPGRLCFRMEGGVVSSSRCLAEP
ncbi:MAG: hypothetical protein ACLQDQ_02565, partial [Myxococcaceae bacterium]